MKNNIFVFLFLVACLVTANASRGQNVTVNRDSTEALEHVFVRIHSNFPEALLFADSLFVGTLSSQVIKVPATTNFLRLVPSEASAWSITPEERALSALPGDTVEIAINFPYHYRIESIPYDAGVLLEVGAQIREIGSTPLLYASEQPIEGTILIKHPGYAVERIDPGDEIWNRYVVQLSASNDLNAGATQVQWRPPKKHRTWIDYAALGTALVAGAFAIHYKFQADELYAKYEESGDASLRPDIKAYDVRSGIAFGAMQAGLGVFAIRLVLR